MLCPIKTACYKFNTALLQQWQQSSTRSHGLLITSPQYRMSLFVLEHYSTTGKHWRASDSLVIASVDYSRKTIWCFCKSAHAFAPCSVKSSTFSDLVEGATHTGILHPRAGRYSGRSIDSSRPGSHLQRVPQRPGWSPHRCAQTPLWLPQGEFLDTFECLTAFGFRFQSAAVVAKLLFVGLFQLLHADKRREYLYQLQEFMVTDNSRNWRFRYELAEYVSFFE